MDSKTKMELTVKALEKDLLTIELNISNTKKAVDSISTALDKVKELEGLVEEEEVAKKFKSLGSHRRMIPAFKRIEEQLKAISKEVERLDERMISSSLFLENFRDARKYYFDKHEKMALFLRMLVEAEGSKDFSFKIEFAGTTNISELIQNNNGIKESQQSIRIPIESLEGLLRDALMRGAFLKSKIEGREFKAIILSTSTIQLEAENPVIRKADNLSREAKGIVLED